MVEVKSYARLWPLAFAAIGVAGLVYAGIQWMRTDKLPVDIEVDDSPVVDTGPDEHYEKVRPHLVDELATYRGEVKAGSPIQVRAPQGMRIPVKQVHHEQGDFVKKGDVLISFPREPIDKAIEEAKAKGDTVNEARFRGYLDYVELKAPCDGIVDQIYQTLGNTPVDEGMPVMTLQDRSAFRFVVRVPGDVQRQSMALSTKFDVELDDDMGSVKGVVSGFDPAIATDVPVVLSLEPHEGIANRTAGAVRVASGRIEAGLVPRTAVTRRGDVPIVRVWDPVSKSIGERTVKLGDAIGPDVVVLGGVFAGDSIVVPGRKPPQ